MPLTDAEISTIARLARLAVQDTDLSRYGRELDGILALVAQMQAVSTAGVAPLAHPLDLAARLRPDQVTETDQHEKFQKIAPAVTDDGYYLVPRVIE